LIIESLNYRENCSKKPTNLFDLPSLSIQATETSVNRNVPL